MKLGICTIQRDRGKWLTEWVAFHHLVGFTHFYIYLHKCKDNSREVVTKLQNHFNIHCYEVQDDAQRPQLIAYEHAYQSHGHEIDWMAFIDGDEFLYPTVNNQLGDALEEYNYEKLSALGIYWKCFGSNGHIQDPNGLIIEDYQSRANIDFLPNRHVKSIVRGRQGNHCRSIGNAHLFKSIYGTFDEQMRFIDKGWMKELEPSHQKFCINHYACQSREFFNNFKQKSGAADANAYLFRSEDWWNEYDRNESHDSSLIKYVEQVKAILQSLH